MSSGPRSAAPASSANSPSFLAFVNDSENLSVMQGFVQAQGWNTSHVIKGDIHDAIDYLDTHPTPEFLLVDVATAAEAADALDRLADLCEPTTRVIVTSTVDEFSFFQWLTQIGVHHYLLKPLNDEALKRAFSHSEPATAKGTDAKKQGKLVAVMGVRGGVGSSTIALNLSAVLSAKHQLHTALLDLEPQWGTASLMLDLEPGRGLREALAKPDRIDALFMERVLLKYNDHLSLLSSEEPFDEEIVIHDEAAETLLRETRQKFDIVVADMPRELTHFTKSVLASADHVILVSELSLTCLRDAMRLADYLRTKLKVRKVHLVASRTGLFGKYEMPAADFEKTLDMKFTGQVPFDTELYAKITNGKIPALEKADSPMAKSMQALAESVHHQKSGKEQPAAAKPKLMKWIKGKPA